jgi:16S rRNA C967 or C1407 C5-methylase (RsmB/RsmF family)/NOL1/NOP2/fmu family ribosome biogenesis protein
MFPSAFRKRIEKQEYIDSKQLLAALGEAAPVSIRINRNKWLKEPLNSAPVPWCRDGYYLDSRPSFTLDPLFHAGCYYPQEASGMISGEIFRQIRNNNEYVRILDLCAAPGGKSIHLSSLAGENGLLVSNEVIRTRAFVLMENLSKWGVPNFIVTQGDPSAFGRLTGFFDIILADVPCSGEGMFRNISVRSEWSESNAELCALRQKRILMDVWPALREDGILIYSTCTFNPAENEDNIIWLSEKTGIESVRPDFSQFEGITEIKRGGIYGYGFYPGRIRGEGFFISVIRKKDTVVEKHAKAVPEKHDKVVPGKHDRAVREKHTKSVRRHTAGVSREEMAAVSGMADFPSGRIVKYRDEVMALPCSVSDYHRIADEVKIVKAGTRLLKSGSVPLHDLALSVKCRPDAFPLADLPYDQALEYLSRTGPAAGNMPEGRNLVQYKGINLGFVKNVGSRINNYYPVEWRIRQQIPAMSEADVIKWTV